MLIYLYDPLGFHVSSEVLRLLRGVKNKKKVDGLLSRKITSLKESKNMGKIEE